VSGRDHLVLTFWVHGRGRDEPEPLHWAKRWWAQAEDYGRRGLGFLGFAIEPVEEVQAVVNPSTKDGYRSEDAGPGFLGRMVGAFSLRGPATAVRSATARLPPPGTYKLGEVHADYVKNASGQYQMLSLVIDVPSSRAPHPGRAIVFWSPEADREGVIGRR
jgi:import inner membrane translocase subunit TIM21